MLFYFILGLKVTQNFIGCLQNIYFNDVSVLYDLKHGNGSTQYHGGPNVQYGCEPIQNTPLSFPRIGTLLSLNLTEKYNLELQMQFRTIQETAILLYIGLTTFDSQTGTDSGILEVKIYYSLSFQMIHLYFFNYWTNWNTLISWVGPLKQIDRKLTCT